MLGRGLLLWGLVAALVLPSTALASHMSMYANNPVEHDDLGRVLEPDGAVMPAGTLASASLAERNLDAGSLNAPYVPGSATDTYAAADANPPHASGKPWDAAIAGTVYARQAAPGCSRLGDSGPERAPSGLCGAATQGWRENAVVTDITLLSPGQVGERGLGDTTGYAPGAFQKHPTDPIVLLDGQITFTVDFNRWFRLDAAVGDACSQAALAGACPFASTMLPTEYVQWAWYGRWADLNGNGVIDTNCVQACGSYRNEFTWYGSCVDSDRVFQPAALEGGICQEDPNPNLPVPGRVCDGSQLPSTRGCAGTTITGYVFPGNLHGGAPGSNCASGGCGTSGDLPGRQVIRFVDRQGDCERPPSCDEVAAATLEEGTTGGDPLLDRQDEAAPDVFFADRTGDLSSTSRHWVADGGNQAFNWDGGWITSLSTLYGVNCRSDGDAAARFDLSSCTFVDVDAYRAWNPTIGQAVLGVKAGLRGVWCGDTPSSSACGDARVGGQPVGVAGATLPSVVHGWPQAARGFDGAANDKRVYDASQKSTTGRLLAASGVLGGAWAREPNMAGDAYVGVAHGACPDAEVEFSGWCNVAVPASGAASCATTSRSPYQCYQTAFRGYLDAHLVRNLAYAVPLAADAPPCLVCFAGPLQDLPMNQFSGVDSLRHPERNRTLGPGGYYGAGALGLWRDGSHTTRENVLGSAGSGTETYGADGWLGFLVRTTGFYRYRGFLPESCTTDQGTAFHEYAECHPYADYNVADPNADVTPYDTLAGPEEEYRGRCSNSGLGTFALHPAGGVWHVPVLVWRNVDEGFGPLFDQEGDSDEVGELVEATDYGVNPDWPFHRGSFVENDGTGLAGDNGALELPVGPARTGAGPLVILRAGHPGDITLRANCLERGGWQTADYVFLPEGNANDDVTTTFSADIVLDPDAAPAVMDHVVDVDFYEAWVRTA